ncbi:hypothetical protein [Kitasatospora sp. NPDC093102]|uniref:hypothetical protein n=1 Tax=Kitasatospora sp. NPDC093102 TaxID=3155069 RepID=UPI003419001F
MPAGAPGRREIIGTIPDTVPPGLQALHVNDAPGPVDLSPLAAAHRLRRLHLNRSVTADLSPLRELPVESLRGTLAGGDLTALAGHRTLRAPELATPAEDGAAAGLAAARLAERETPMAEAPAWAAGLGLDTGGALRLRLR